MHDLLTERVEGKIILATFAAEKKIDHLFADLVIFSEWDLTNSYTILTPRWEKIAKECVKEFNPEGKIADINEKFFFHAYRRSQSGRQAVNPGGLLYNRYLKLRGKLRVLKILTTTDLLPHGKALSKKKFVFSLFICIDKIVNQSSK